MLPVSKWKEAGFMAFSSIGVSAIFYFHVGLE
jgi:hypothetical protein